MVGFGDCLGRHCSPCATRLGAVPLQKHELVVQLNAWLIRSKGSPFGASELKCSGHLKKFLVQGDSFVQVLVRLDLSKLESMVLLHGVATREGGLEGSDWLVGMPDGASASAPLIGMDLRILIRLWKASRVVM